MAMNSRIVQASPEQVWEVLCDGWLYPLWVVGASRMRDVDEHWPAEGSRLHHSVGSWPLLLDDHTEVMESTPGTMLRLKARAWPTGEAHVTLRLSPAGSGTEVVIEEDAASGPARLVPGPLRSAGMKWRNAEALRRLAFVAERRT